jgi:hypothetical protein
MDIVANVVQAIVRDTDDIASAHGTYLSLQKPFSEASFMKNVLTVRYLHYLLLFIEVL